MKAEELIKAGEAVVGIEFGSTRIKAVMVDADGHPIAQGGHTWENQYENGVWTYSLDMIWNGLQDCYSELVKDVKAQYGVEIKKLKAIGISAMMHGYMPFNAEGELMVPFRTWRNTITEQAAKELTELLGFNIPQRWSIAHIYQAVLNGEEHVKDITFFTTLAGYIHWKLTGEKVLGIGDASGMFPIDSRTRDYNTEYIAKFDELAASKGVIWKLGDILPKVIVAGEPAGTLTEEGAKLLDVSGNLEAGCMLCPPEGDAGTGMTATNSIAVGTGNVSAGTSIFAMVVMEKALKNVHEEIDVVTTPVGDDVAMVHCNNCTSDINAWANIFKEYSEAIGAPVDMNKLYTTMFKAALDGDADCGGLMGFNYFSGEPVTGFEEGRPLFMRKLNSNFSFANFMRLHLYSAVSTLKYGYDILLNEENVNVKAMYGHGGFFKTEKVGQEIMSAALKCPITVMETAGEGGAWGIAVLALFAALGGGSLDSFLSDKIFADVKASTESAPEEAVKGFDKFMEDFRAAFSVEEAAVKAL